MAHEIRPIRTNAGYEQALAEVERVRATCPKIQVRHDLT